MKPLNGTPAPVPSPPAPKKGRRPLPPEILASALQDTVHKTIGRLLAAKRIETKPSRKAKLKTFEVWEQMPSVQAESEEDARNKLPKGRVFKVEELTK